MHNNFLQLSDWTYKELQEIVNTAIELKKNDYREPVATGKVLGLFFNNPSLRTQVSFQVAASHIGASSVVIQPGKNSWNIETTDGSIMNGMNQEHIKELVPVLSNYVDALGVRYFASLKDEFADKNDVIINKMASLASVPVINMEGSLEHPCQGMADWMTLSEQFGSDLSGVNVVLTWAPHPSPLPRAVPNSALQAFTKSGANVTLACPPEMILDERVITNAQNNAKKHNSKFAVTHDRNEAFQKANVIYAKSWHASSIYENKEEEKRVRMKYADWTVTQKDMESTDSANFMHCLPIRRNVVATDDVLDAPGALHIQEAGNRLHVQKALLMKLWNL